MKFQMSTACEELDMSHPARVGGLKLCLLGGVHPTRVPPREGGWIEIHKRHQVNCQNDVPPREGGWIEISAAFLSAKALKSHPARVGGLKSGAMKLEAKSCTSPTPRGWVD